MKKTLTIAAILVIIIQGILIIIMGAKLHQARRGQEEALNKVICLQDKAIGLQDEVLCALQLKKISYDIINYIVKEGGNPITLNQFIEQLVKDSTCPITDKGYEGTFVPTEYYVEGKTFNRDKHKH